MPNLNSDKELHYWSCDHYKICCTNHSCWTLVLLDLNVFLSSCQMWSSQVGWSLVYPSIPLYFLPTACDQYILSNSSNTKMRTYLVTSISSQQKVSQWGHKNAKTYVDRKIQVPQLNWDMKSRLIYEQGWLKVQIIWFAVRLAPFFPRNSD